MSRYLVVRSLMLSTALTTLSGCFLCHDRCRPPHITAHPASPGNQCSPAGIPFYLPKPMLVISKNFYHIEDPKVGLTGTAPIPSGFDNQAEYADVTLNGEFTRSGKSEMISGGDAADAQSESLTGNGEQTASIAHSPTLHSASIPSAPESDAIPGDGLGPHTFFTYEIVFVPDLTEKYVLEVNGGPGEVRAAMNLVNGWQFTGLGPYYMKDSSTAQNAMSRGVALNLGLGGAADIVNSVANLKSLAGTGTPVDPSAIAAMAEALEEAKKTTVFDIDCLKDKWVQKTVSYDDGRVETVWVPPTLERYAEIYVYEACNDGGQMIWKPVANHCFDRQYLGVVRDARLGNGGTTAQGFQGDRATPAGPDPSGNTEVLPPGEIQATSSSESLSLDASPVEFAAKHAMLNSAMQAAGYEAVATGSGSGVRAMAADGTGFEFANSQFVPARAEERVLPAQILDSAASAQAVRQALAPACAPQRRSWHECLFPWKKAEQRTCEVNGVVTQ